MLHVIGLLSKYDWINNYASAHSLILLSWFIFLYHLHEPVLYFLYIYRNCNGIHISSHNGGDCHPNHCFDWNHRKHPLHCCFEQERGSIEKKLFKDTYCSVNFWHHFHLINCSSLLHEVCNFLDKLKLILWFWERFIITESRFLHTYIILVLPPP